MNIFIEIFLISNMLKFYYKIDVFYFIEIYVKFFIWMEIIHYNACDIEILYFSVFFINLKN